MAHKAVLWDLGKVLLDWSPAYLYRKIFRNEDAVQDFLGRVCTMEWHQAHDRGVPMAENRRALIAQYPEHEAAITAWETRFPEMLQGSVPGTAEAIEALAARGIPQYALTNLPAEWVEPVNRLYPAMRHMRDTIVSAHEGVIKPDRRIYEITAARLPHDPADVIFFDDREANVIAAREFGFDSELFTDETKLRSDLAARGLL
ncbi:HAD family hydrolase [Maricaulis salignorans]|uniref:2-haloacid dehalogenase n=1 Tax=Maricaulis salignorans TaxID=144026 RepID=A0A1G9QK10_9PROT|nr:HAD family phosphatase [Maricaulis salignorans]SDM11338.1 2-haloacid dehalogenase [Maricaulis salignorans]